jgi:hypothetical protein
MYFFFFLPRRGLCGGLNTLPSSFMPAVFKVRGQIDPAAPRLNSINPYIKNRLNDERSNHVFSFSWRDVVAKFDYSAPAELFPSRNRKIKSSVKYRRFDKAADAIRFAMEELPAPVLLGAVIESGEARLGHEDIRDLYESADYPLKKAALT